MRCVRRGSTAARRLWHWPARARRIYVRSRVGSGLWRRLDTTGWAEGGSAGQAQGRRLKIEAVIAGLRKRSRESRNERASKSLSTTTTTTKPISTADMPPTGPVRLMLTPAAAPHWLQPQPGCDRICNPSPALVAWLGMCLTSRVSTTICRSRCFNAIGTGLMHTSLRKSGSFKSCTANSGSASESNTPHARRECMHQLL